MELKRVVVTGLGAITPLGKTVEESWTNLVNGVSGSGPITRFDATKFKTTFACEVKSRSAALPQLPASAQATKYSSSLSSTLFLLPLSAIWSDRTC